MTILHGQFNCGAAGYALFALAAVLLAGCGAETVETEYGQQSNPFTVSSVNGTAVLGDMFREAGHRVAARRALTAKVRKSADVIVWVPDDKGVPDPAAQQWLEDWLWAEPDRTLIYVGRDYDAAPAYWKKVQPGAPADRAAEVQQQLTQAEVEFDMRRAEFPKSEDCRWFVVKGAKQHRQVSTLGGPYSAGIDASLVDIELYGRLELPLWAEALEKKSPADRAAAAAPGQFMPIEAGYEVLLESEGDVLVTRYRRESYGDWQGSQLIVVTNGSFLLNMPLVNHEHRKLAGRLIGEVPEASSVVFLESDEFGPPIGESDDNANLSSGMQVLKVWPLNFVLLHLAVLGIVFCFARLPIFGRPRELATASPSDFGQHLTALGKLLSKTKDRDYALARLRHYQQTVRSEAGRPAGPRRHPPTDEVQSPPADPEI